MYVLNLSEIAQSAAKLLVINDIFFASFQGVLQYCQGSFEKGVDRSAPNLVGKLPDHRYSGRLKKVKIPCSVPNYSGSKSSVVEGKDQKSHNKIRCGMGKISQYFQVVLHMTDPPVYN